MKYDQRFFVGNVSEQSVAEVLTGAQRWQAARRLQHCVDCWHTAVNEMLHEHFHTAAGQRSIL